MKPLRLALVHRASGRSLRRMGGPFCYEVPEFTWEHFPVIPNFRAKRADFAGFDAIIYEDGKLHGSITGKGPPVVYMVGDSTLSEAHYQLRRRVAAQSADLVLVDWDQLERFANQFVPVRRLSYCVNDRLFCPRGDKQHDVTFLARFKGAPERYTLAKIIKSAAEKRGWLVSIGHLDGMAYSRAFSEAKIGVNLARNATTRNYRVFDVMASGSCLLTDPVPPVSDEPGRDVGVHYAEFETLEEVPDKVAWLLAEDRWEGYAERALESVRKHHTWAVRAGQLRAILADELGL